MTIQLPRPQREWLQQRVADGTFATTDEAAKELIDERMALEADDLDWVRGDVEEARTDVAAGQFMTLDEHLARNADRLAKLLGK